jgi:hypothetical protein
LVNVTPIGPLVWQEATTLEPAPTEPPERFRLAALEMVSPTIPATPMATAANFRLVDFLILGMAVLLFGSGLPVR